MGDGAVMCGEQIPRFAREKQNVLGKTSLEIGSAPLFGAAALKQRTGHPEESLASPMGVGRGFW